MSEIMERYHKLELKEYQTRSSYYYPFVCEELSLILRSAYPKLPKNLQSILFQDVLASFRFLPQQVHTHYGTKSASLLLQAAEVVMPKQKRALAVAEFKHAVVAYKRRQKVQKDVEGSAQFPEDILMQIFSFLDMRSLVAVSLVCWSWNSAASDNRLWQIQYEMFFGGSNSSCKSKGQIGEPTKKSLALPYKKDDMDLMATGWREAFKEMYIGNSSRRFTSNRGYCVLCKSVVWLSDMKCPNTHHGSKLANQQINPVSPRQVVEYLLHGSISADSSSESDSDSDEESSLTLWRYKVTELLK